MTYSTPKGLVPQAMRYVGYLLAAYFGYGIAYSIMVGITMSGSNLWNWFVPGFLTAISLLMLCASVGLMAVFPSIKITDTGIKYKYFFFLEGLIQWSEIVDLVELQRPRGAWAIVISRKGYSFFNKRGLFYNSFYGNLIGRVKPVLFLSAGLDNLGIVINEIRRRRVGYLSLPPFFA